MSNGKKIIIHCSASPFGHVIMIDGWHRERGWKGVGYHNVIMNGFPTQSQIDAGRRIRIYDGSIELGRTLDADDDIESWEAGAHCYGYNQNTIGICLIGNGMFTKNQIIALVKVVKLYQFQFGVPTDKVLGHCELTTQKTCPNLDMDIIRAMVTNKTQSINLFKKLSNVLDG